MVIIQHQVNVIFSFKVFGGVHCLYLSYNILCAWLLFYQMLVMMLFMFI